MFSFLEKGLSKLDNLTENFYENGCKIGENIGNKIPLVRKGTKMAAEFNITLMNDTIAEGKMLYNNLPENVKNVANIFSDKNESTVNERIEFILNKRKLLDEEERLFLLKYAGDTQ